MEEGKCSSLEAWEITLIVIGSILCAVLLKGLFTCCYRSGYCSGEGKYPGRSYEGGLFGGGGGAEGVVEEVEAEVVGFKFIYYIIRGRSIPITKLILIKNTNK